MKNINSVPHAVSYLSKHDSVAKKSIAKYWGLSIKLISRNDERLSGKFYQLNYDRLISVLVENIFAIYRLAIYLSKVNSTFNAPDFPQYSEKEQDYLTKSLSEHRQCARDDMSIYLTTALAVCMLLQNALDGRTTRSLEQVPFTFKNYESLRCLAYKIISRSVDGKELLAYSSKPVSERVVDKSGTGENITEVFLAPSISTLVACFTGYWIGCGRNPVTLFKDSYQLVENLIEQPPVVHSGTFIDHLTCYDFISALNIKKEGSK